MKKLKYLFTYSLTPLIAVSCAGTSTPDDSQTENQPTQTEKVTQTTPPVLKPPSIPAPYVPVVSQPNNTPPKKENYKVYKDTPSIYALPENLDALPTREELVAAPDPDSGNSETIITPPAP